MNIHYNEVPSSNEKLISVYLDNILPKMIKQVAQNIEQLKRLCEKYEVKTMYLFGSAVSGDFNESSDVDFLIAFKEIPFDKYTDNYFNLLEDLEALFGRKVDLVTEKSLSNPFFIKTVDNTKQLLYAG